MAATGKRVDVKGNSVDVEGNRVAVTGNRVDVKGDSVDVKGNRVAVTGNRVDVNGNSVDVKGKRGRFPAPRPDPAVGPPGPGTRSPRSTRLDPAPGICSLAARDWWATWHWSTSSSQ
eukprot:564509-Pyramimonas_sp.AAC.1